MKDQSWSKLKLWWKKRAIDTRRSLRIVRKLEIQVFFGEKQIEKVWDRKWNLVYGKKSDILEICLKWKRFGDQYAETIDI